MFAELGMLVILTGVRPAQVVCSVSALILKTPCLLLVKTLWWQEFERVDPVAPFSVFTPLKNSEVRGQTAALFWPQRNDRLIGYLKEPT